ncbi:hypothetical protein AX774_g5284 [Zancudomyces culisetae]|uniref:Uncharacterized protein n=1 Tax=Zancudomyces culisetae TaxID=1213189 RepID=A0A1R1PK08_ZANCU|nr:hypothetical protein AX774_g5284 [Zancudomyces culisetae]|eukprot:OMH81269.1 hypothetical protein AX774_g5284 [Zancudomyces culisetae]
MNGKVVIINWKTQDAIIYRETNNAKVCSTCHLSDGLILIMDSHWNYKIIKLSEDVVVTESIELGTLDVPRNTQSTFEKSGYKVTSISERKADENSAYPEPQSQPEFLQVWPDTKDPSSFLAIAWCAKKVQFAKITIAAADMPVQTHTIKTFSIVANSDSICRCVHPKRLFISDNSYLDPHTRFCNYTLDGDGTVLDLGVPTVSASENSPILDVDLSGVSEDATPSLFAMDNDSLVSVFNDGTVCYLSFN